MNLLDRTGEPILTSWSIGSKIIAGHTHFLLSTGTMLKSRSIRVAVNLCVIGAILVSMAAMAGGVRDRCGNQFASKQTCPGCGCCAVLDHGVRCQCCDNAQPTGDRQPGSSQMACCSKKQSATVKPDRNTGVPGICMCGKSVPQPAVPSRHGRTATEQLVPTCLPGYPMSVSIGLDLTPRASLWEDSAPSLLLPRDAQRRLCVWRI